MPQFLVTIQLPDNYDPSLEDEEMVRDINALNEELDAAGARVFAGGLTSEHGEVTGGFSILEAADMDEALPWARKVGCLSGAGRGARDLLPPTK